MLNEPNENQEARERIARLLERAEQDAEEALEHIDGPQSRLVFIREYYMPVVISAARALEMIKP